MPVVIEMALKAAEQVLEASGRLVEHPHSKDVRLMLVRGSHGVLEGTMKVLKLTVLLFGFNSLTIFASYRYCWCGIALR